MTTTLRVLATGPFATIQDLGRTGLADLGVSRSGAADRTSYDLGARLVGHSARRAAIEVTFGGLVVRASADVLIALTGADPRATVDGRRVAYAEPVHLRAGEVLTLGVPTSGLRTYVSVRGGIEVAPVLGSRSFDSLADLGPAPLRVGDVLPVGRVRHTRYPAIDQPAARPPSPFVLRLEATVGPRADWVRSPVTAAAGPPTAVRASEVVETPVGGAAGLSGQWWRVSTLADRIGVRLDGTPISWAADRHGSELPTEGMVRGAVQVPPNGQPIVFMADHPVTGGYPVVAVIRARDVDRLAQARPGQEIRIAMVEEPDPG